MQVLFAVIAAAALAVAVYLKRRSRNIDAGQVSESWLREQRADKRDGFMP